MPRNIFDPKISKIPEIPKVFLRDPRDYSDGINFWRFRWNFDDSDGIFWTFEWDSEVSDGIMKILKDCENYKENIPEIPIRFRRFRMYRKDTKNSDEVAKEIFAPQNV